MLKDIILEKIKEEIENDPLGIGYKGKTNEEIVYLLNNEVSVERVVIEKMQSPISRILSGIQSAPNSIDIDDIKQLGITNG